MVAAANLRCVSLDIQASIPLELPLLCKLSDANYRQHSLWAFTNLRGLLTAGLMHVECFHSCWLKKRTTARLGIWSSICNDSVPALYACRGNYRDGLKQFYVDEVFVEQRPACPETRTAAAYTESEIDHHEEVAGGPSLGHE